MALWRGASSRRPSWVGLYDVDRSGEVPLRPLCRRCFTLYEPCVEWMKDCRRDGGFNYAHVDHAALEWEKEEIDEYMPRAVRLSRLFKGVARAAGRLLVLHRRAVERVYLARSQSPLSCEATASQFGDRARFGLGDEL